MNTGTRRPPLLVHPDLIALDDALYRRLIDTIGQELAAAALDAVWSVLTDPRTLVGRVEPHDDNGDTT